MELFAMLDERYLLIGLDALSRAHTSDFFNNGHRAASVIAAYYLCHENRLSEPAQKALQQHLDVGLAADDFFDDAPDVGNDGIMSVTPILDTLAAGIGDLRVVGHNVIFAAAALKAFDDLPQARTEARVEGIYQLIDSFDTTQNVDLADDDRVPQLSPEAPFIEFVFREFLASLQLYRGFGQGWAGHLLTFGHALLQLARLGHSDIATRGCPAYAMYLKTMRRGPKEGDPRISDRERMTSTPLEEAYWRDREPILEGLGHAFKYPRSFYDLLNGLDDAPLKQQCLDESYQIF
jgi:hypothetical protein